MSMATLSRVVYHCLLVVVRDQEADNMDFREVGFELVANTRKVSVHRVRFDVMTHVYCVQAESVGSRFHRHVVHAYE